MSGIGCGPVGASTARSGAGQRAAEPQSPDKEKSKAVQFEARAWLNAVRNATGDGLFRLVKRFSTAGSQRPLTVEETRKLLPTWKRYAAGSRRPNTDTVRRVEAVVPGTAAWLDLAFWRLLSSEPIDLVEIRTILALLHPEVRRFVFHSGQILRSSVFRKSSKRKPLNRKACDRLGKLGRAALQQDPPDLILFFDALACAIVLMREARLVENDAQHFQGHRLFLWLSPGLEIVPETSAFSAELRERVTEVGGAASYFLP